MSNELQQWEYKVVERKGTFIISVLDKAGIEGWELVQIIDNRLSDLSHQWIYIFKKPKTSAQ